MFNNIFYFIFVLLIFTLSNPENIPKDKFGFGLLTLLITWLIFVWYCRWRFTHILKKMTSGVINQNRTTSLYHQTQFRLSVLAIILFAVAVFLLELKSWINLIPAVSHFSALQGIMALLLFLIYLCTIWYFSFPVYVRIYRQEITRHAFIRSNVRLNLPVLFPWFILSIVYDFLAMTPWGGAGGFLSGITGNIIFFSGFIVLLMIYMPVVIQYWWGCRPFGATEKIKELEAFMREKGFRHRKLLKWPIFQGRMMTAGIMGIVPRYRYILVTDSLMEILTTEELKAVIAHEMGHAKYRHLIFYGLFIIGFMFIIAGLEELLTYAVYQDNLLLEIFSRPGPNSDYLYFIRFSMPILIVFLVYFRYVMGFFMRNFERQADLYAAKTLDSAEPVIRSLEKIAYFSGKNRDLPSWHHFSIKQRVDCLNKARYDRNMFRRHNKLVLVSFIGYVFLMGVFNYFVYFSDFMDNQRDLRIKETYEKVLQVNPHQAIVLNNLAWLLITSPHEVIRDDKRGLILAQQAVALESAAIYLDTLAEAYYVNGMPHEAVETIKEAISRATENKGYYQQQLEKYLSSGDRQ